MSLANEYLEYCKKYNAIWEYLQAKSKPLEEITSDICKYRMYFDSYGRWYNIFSEVGVAYIDDSIVDLSNLKNSKFNDMALFSKEGNFLLNKRYILPIKDMVGNVIALVGWYRDSKKYITTPSKFFSKDCLFFGMEQLGNTGIGKSYFLVEGIFDALSLRSLGLNAVAQMGIIAGRKKEILYGLFSRLVAIPDNDTQGKKVLTEDKWSLPINASYFRWRGEMGIDENTGESINIKDIDMLCNLYEESEVKSLLISCLRSSERIITIEL